MKKKTEWLIQAGNESQCNEQVLDEILCGLKQSNFICLVSCNKAKSLGVAAKACAAAESATYWTNLAGCEDQKDIILCIGESVGCHQGDEHLIAGEIRAQTIFIIQEFTSACLEGLRAFRELWPNTTWVAIAEEELPWNDCLHFHLDDNTEPQALEAPPPSNAIEKVLCVLPSGLPRQTLEGEPSHLLYCGEGVYAPTQYRNTYQAEVPAIEVANWLTQYLEPQLRIAADQTIPECTTTQHLFALGWLKANSPETAVVNACVVARAMILYAWNQPSRALKQLEGLDTEDPILLITSTIIQLKACISIGHWKQISQITKNSSRTLKIHGSDLHRSELRRQVASLYVTLGKPHLAEEELQVALKLCEGDKSQASHSRVLRDMAALGIASKEKISSKILLKQVLRDSLCPSDLAHYLLMKSELLQQREDEQAAEILLNQAESVENENPISIANRQRRRAALALSSGKFQAALGLIQKASRLFSICGEHHSHGHSIRLHADIQACQGNAKEAERLYKKAIALQLSIRDNKGLRRSLEHIHMLYEHCGRQDASRKVDNFLELLGTT